MEPIGKEANMKITRKPKPNDLRACIVCGTPTAVTFFCPCDGHHPICEGNHADSVPRLDCAFIWAGTGHFTTRTGAQ